MATDGEADYRTFTRAQLEEALTRIDRTQFPLDFARLTAAHEQRRQEEFLGSLPPPSAGGLTRQPLEFTGDGREYFRIWIVNLALTVVTLGIYSAWAKVRKQRYFYSNTLLDGSAFGYHAEPLKILKGRIIAVLLIAAYFIALRVSVRAALSVVLVLALVTPWLFVKSRAFISRVSSWRGIRFNFRQDYLGAYKALLGYLVLAIVTLGILLPRLTRERYTFLVSRTSFGREEFDCSPRIGPFYSAAWAGGALVAGVSIVTGLLITGFKHSAIATEMSPAMVRVTALALPLLNYAIVGPVFLGFTKARYLNELLNHTQLGAHRLAADFDPGKLIGIYLTNVLLIIATAGIFIPWAQVRVALPLRLDRATERRPARRARWRAATRIPQRRGRGNQLVLRSGLWLLIWPPSRYVHTCSTAAPLLRARSPSHWAAPAPTHSCTSAAQAVSKCSACVRPHSASASAPCIA